MVESLYQEIDQSYIGLHVKNEHYVPWSYILNPQSAFLCRIKSADPLQTVVDPSFEQTDPDPAHLYTLYSL